MRLLGRLVGLMGRLLLPSATVALRAAIESAYVSYSTTVKPNLSPLFPTALVLAEDRRFFWHRGIDPLGIARAIWRLVAYRRVEGASTIEQQLVRCLTGRYERTLRRKTREVLLAPCVEQVVRKADIPGLYLSVAYFGWRATGIEQAAERFGVSLLSPSPRQVATLVARITHPEPQVAPLLVRGRILRRAALIEDALAGRGPFPRFLASSAPAQRARL